MEIPRKELERLILHPSESLDTELKQWIDPRKPEGIAKIAKACIALRNNNGGCLIVGIKNDGQPDPDVLPDARVAFHPDVIQAIVGKYASEPFEVAVEFVEREGIEFPVVCIPSGVETPVASKSELPAPTEDGSPLIRCNTVYVRTINSNHTVSSSAATWKDWPKITRTCFDNREADIGSFIRRHLANADLGQLASLLGGAKSKPALADRAREFLEIGRKRFAAAMTDRNKKPLGKGAFEVAVVIDGELTKHLPDQKFYWLLQATKPSHSGWPFWLDAGLAQGDEFSPYVFEGAWEALMVGKVIGEHMDFWRAEPSGRFYHLRGLEEDLDQRIDPGTILDWQIWTRRLTEVVSIATHFASSLAADVKTIQLGFACRWEGLKGRRLISLSDRGFGRQMGVSQENAITTAAVMPADTPPLGFVPTLESLLAPLFATFAGSRVERSVIEQIARDVFNQRY